MQVGKLRNSVAQLYERVHGVKGMRVGSGMADSRTGASRMRAFIVNR